MCFNRYLLLFSGMDGVLGATATGPGGLGARFFLLPAEEFRLLSKPTGKQIWIELNPCLLPLSSQKFAVAIRYSAFKLQVTCNYIL